MNEISVKFEPLYWASLQKFRPCACFFSVVVITCALHAQSPQFDTGQKHAFGVLFTENEKSKIPQRTELVLHQTSFCSVVVITCAHTRNVPSSKLGGNILNTLRS